jgi:hypothetical protein
VSNTDPTVAQFTFHNAVACAHCVRHPTDYRGASYSTVTLDLDGGDGVNHSLTFFIQPSDRAAMAAHLRAIAAKLESAQYQNTRASSGDDAAR